MVERKGLKAVGYIRVSTEEQAREGVSLVVQETRVRAFCEAKGWELLRLYRDPGASGKSLNRPGIRSLISDLKGNGVDVVVIVKLDRLTRSIRDLGTLIDDLFQGVDLASVDESLDSSTAGGRMVINLLGSVAQWEREVIGERTKAALDHKATVGEWRGRVPFGFRINEAGKLVEDANAMGAIESMKRAHRRGKSVRRLADEYGVSKSTVHKVVTTDLRTIKKEAARIV
jgi:DNA invertase Pin-like site-specific DNA recombinase